jgi:hypothetical protein
MRRTPTSKPYYLEQLMAFAASLGQLCRSVPVGIPYFGYSFPAFDQEFPVRSLRELISKRLKIGDYFARLSQLGADEAGIPCRIPCSQVILAEQGAYRTAVPASHCAGFGAVSVSPK